MSFRQSRTSQDATKTSGTSQAALYLHSFAKQSKHQILERDQLAYEQAPLGENTQSRESWGGGSSFPTS